MGISFYLNCESNCTVRVTSVSMESESHSDRMLNDNILND